MLIYHEHDTFDDISHEDFYNYDDYAHDEAVNQHADDIGKLSEQY